jgi:hypothetical protein
MTRRKFRQYVAVYERKLLACAAGRGDKCAPDEWSERVSRFIGSMLGHAVAADAAISAGLRAVDVCELPSRVAFTAGINGRGQLVRLRCDEADMWKQVVEARARATEPLS